MTRRPYLQNTRSNNLLPDDQEESLRKIREVEEAEELMRERILQADSLQTVNFIREGVGMKVAKSLEANFPEARTETGLVDVIKREKVQNELFKAISGTDIYEHNPYTEHFRDLHNLGRSDKSDYFSRNLIRKAGAKVEDLMWGTIKTAISTVNSRAENIIEERFGPESLPVAERRLFAANRTRTILNTIEGINQANIDLIANTLNIPVVANRVTLLNEIVRAMSEADLTTLQQLHELDFPVGANLLTADNGFLDLRLIAYIDKRETGKIAVASIYDNKRLHRIVDLLSKGKFLDDSLPFPVAEEQNLLTLLNRILQKDTFYKLEKNYDAKAFIVTIEDRLKTIEVTPEDFADISAAYPMLPPGSEIFLKICRLKAFIREIALIANNELPGGAPVSPFVLMERIARREYCQSHNNLDPSIFHEGASSHAQLTARLRAAEAENVDVYRTMNRDAAENLDKGYLRKTYRRIGEAIGSAQRKLGLEVIEVEEQSADDVLRQIVALKPEFKIFEGVNKYTSVRDLRELLNRNSTGNDVIEVFKEFRNILQQTLQGFKSGKKNNLLRVAETDWDLGNLVTVLQKMELTLQGENLIEQAKIRAAEPGVTYEQAYLELLQSSREAELSASKKIREDVEKPNAQWKLLFSKDVLKGMLSEESSKRKKLISGSALEALEKQKSEANTQEEKNKIEIQINQVKEDMKKATSLYDRVEAARKFVQENNLSKSEAKEYYQQIGLAQVMDKMSTNHKLQSIWLTAKKAAGWSWEKTKATYNWLADDKNIVKKAASYPGGLLIRPAYAVGSFGYNWTFGLLGKAVGKTVALPGSLLRRMSKTMMARYLISRPRTIEKELRRLKASTDKLQQKLARQEEINYGYNYTMFTEARIQKKMIEMNQLLSELGELKETATKRGLKIYEVKTP